MALKKCFECKGTVSTEAKTCPHCGVRNPAPSGLNPAIVRKWINVFLVVGWPLFIIAFLLQASHNANGFYH